MLNLLTYFFQFSLSLKLRIKPAFFITGIFLGLLNAHAQQNLVINGDMEIYSSCPQTESYPAQSIKEIEKCIGWKAPTHGTSDYFNTCAIATNVDVPNNILGEQMPFDGNGYLGAYFTSYTGGTGSDGYSGIMWWEYVQGKTAAPLENGKIYKFSLELSLAEYSDLIINEIGAYFSESPISTSNTASLQLVPQCIFRNQDYYSDTVNWMHLETFFVANGKENYFTIGNYRNNSGTDTVRRIDWSPQGIVNPYVTYMYIDHVILHEASTAIPNIFTPNGDGINDVWELSFSGNSENRVSVMNRWGNLIYESGLDNFSWNGKTQNGVDATEGTYFYRISNTNIAGFIELVR